MDQFSKNLLTEWRRLKLPFEGANILIAVSGGADSCAAALAIHDLAARKKIANKFTICHFNHRQRGTQSDEDFEFVKQLASGIDFDFVGGELAGDTIDPDGNLEQELRNARYNFLLQTASSRDCFGIITAHTINDQAETFLMNMIRGSGLDGLSGMSEVRSFGSAEFGIAGTEDDRGDNSGVLKKPLLIRPLLTWATREETEGFVSRQNFEFRDDSMNHDIGFTRVRIRKELIRELKSYNPNIVETLARTSKLIRDSKSVIEGIEAEVEKTETLKVRSLQIRDDEHVRIIVRKWLRGRRGSLRKVGLVQIDSIVSLIRSRKSGRLVELPDGGQVLKQGGLLHFRDSKVEK